MDQKWIFANIFDLMTTHLDQNPHCLYVNCVKRPFGIMYLSKSPINLTDTSTMELKREMRNVCRHL